MTITVALDGTRQYLASIPAALTFVEQPLGLPSLGHATIEPLDKSGFAFTLRGEGPEGIRLYLVSPRAYYPAYAPSLPTQVPDAFGRAGASAPVPLAVVHPGTDGDTTVNLLAPIYVDPDSGKAIQVVLDDEWPLRAPLGAGHDAP